MSTFRTGRAMTAATVCHSQTEGNEEDSAADGEGRGGIKRAILSVKEKREDSGKLEYVLVSTV